MRLGPMRERVRIQQAERTADAVGQRIPSWIDVDTVWARCEHLSGAELERARAIHQEISVRMTMHYRTDFTTRMRAFWRETPWNIHAILPDEKTRQMQLLTSVIQ